MAGAWLTVLLALQAQPLDRIVVTTAGQVDAQRLSDALHVYLEGFDISIESAPGGDAADLRSRMAEARRLGDRVRAVAVVHAQGDSPDAIEIELDDLTTQKTLIAALPKPQRDEDLYRTLALKIQALLRATLSEARGTLDPQSAAGRLAIEDSVTASGGGRGRLALETGYQAVSLAAAGVVLQGLSVVASWAPSRRFDVSLGTAAFGSVHASSGGVEAVAEILPVFAAGRARWRWRNFEMMAGPCVEVALVRVTALGNAMVQVRSPQNFIFALGGEAEGRVELSGPVLVYARADALGVLEGPSYDVGGASILDTSRLHLAASVGLGVVFP